MFSEKINCAICVILSWLVTPFSVPSKYYLTFFFFDKTKADEF